MLYFKLRHNLEKCQHKKKWLNTALMSLTVDYRHHCVRIKKSPGLFCATDTDSRAVYLINFFLFQQTAWKGDLQGPYCQY